MESIKDFLTKVAALKQEAIFLSGSDAVYQAVKYLNEVEVHLQSILYQRMTMGQTKAVTIGEQIERAHNEESLN